VQRVKKKSWWFLMIVCFAWIMRLGTDIQTHSVYNTGDAIHYNYSALNLLRYHVFGYWTPYPSAHVTPGYPLFLAACYRLASLLTPHHGAWQLAAVYAQGLISSVGVGLIFLIARRFLSTAWALVPAVLWSIFPPAIRASRLLLTETVYLTMLLLFVWSFILATEKNRYGKSWLYWLLSGLILGATALVRPTVVPLVAAPIIVFILRHRLGASQVHSGRRSLRDWGSYLIGFITLMLPWWIRNKLVLHQWILTDQDMGNPLLYGTDPNFQHDPQLAQGLSYHQQRMLAFHRIVSQFVHHPLHALQWYTIDKIKYLYGTPWFGHIHAGFVGSLQDFLIHASTWLILIGAIGLIVGWQYLETRLVTVFTLFLVIVKLPFIPINRYAFETKPFLFMGVAILGYTISVTPWQTLWNRAVNRAYNG
jgi:4-amino-4-deoxy-L-arabinose transferase-like glycosyltransferase